MQVEDAKNGSPRVQDQALLKMAFPPQTSSEIAAASKLNQQKTARGFVKSIAKQTGTNTTAVNKSEYTFFKKKVRLNVVEKKVHKFDLDEEEVNQKKAKKKTSARKNF